MLRPTYPISTARLLLRPYDHDDFAGLYDLLGRADVNRYLYEQPRSPEEVRQLIDERTDKVALNESGDLLSLVIARQEAPEAPIGTAMLNWVSEEHGHAEVGYTIHPDHHGKGYATEVTRTLVDLGFRDTKLHRITGRLDARNTASHRVLEKSGMRTEAHLVENEWVKGEWTSEIVCAILRPDWEAAQLLD
jgi:RimJ/RimL family protein N-acetyltransferase